MKAIITMPLTDFDPEKTKTCSKCLVKFPATLEHFSPARRGKYGLTQKCKPCANAHTKDWYNNKGGKAWHLKDQSNRRADLANWVDTFKDVPCADCGVKYPPYVMDFDHLSAHEKLFPIGVLVNKRLSKDTILAEINKCEVVCSNCHRERTRARGQWKGQRYNASSD
jgi:hypothetical protein